MPEDGCREMKGAERKSGKLSWAGIGFCVIARAFAACRQWESLTVFHLWRNVVRFVFRKMTLETARGFCGG